MDKDSPIKKLERAVSEVVMLLAGKVTDQEVVSAWEKVRVQYCGEESIRYREALGKVSAMPLPGENVMPMDGRCHDNWLHFEGLYVKLEDQLAEGKMREEQFKIDLIRLSSACNMIDVQAKYLDHMHAGGS
ncbi:MAG: hypothetical protein KJ709_08370 [Nanoarchaeota archaeon]|nr:hypothetical protein [Nanoarchaeota archaeon]